MDINLIIEKPEHPSIRAFSSRDIAFILHLSIETMVNVIEICLTNLSLDNSEVYDALLTSLD